MTQHGPDHSIDTGGEETSQPSEAAVDHNEQSPPSRLNVFGVIALGLLILNQVLIFAAPFIVPRTIQSAESFSIFIQVSVIIRGGLTLAALILAIVGVLQKHATRMRWTAIGSLVAAALQIPALVALIITNLTAAQSF